MDGSTNSNLPTKRTRRRMEIKIYFRLRSSQAKDLQPRPIMVRLTMDKVTVSDYMSGVVVRPAKWDQSNQMVKGRGKVADDLNEELAKVDNRHRDILRELKRRYHRGEGPRPTPELVKSEFLRPGSSSPTLLDFYNEYLAYLDSLCDSEDGRAEKTMARAYKTRDYIVQYENPGLKKGVIPKSIQLLDITANWGKGFHVWLQINPITQKRRMLKDTANKYLSHVRDALTYALDGEYIPKNPLDQFRPKRGKGKPVYFLEGEQIDKLMDFQATDLQLAVVLWWSRLMALTAMDYKDAIRYARNRQMFEQPTPSGKKIIINRSKGDFTAELPVLPQVEVLFDIFPSGPPNPPLADINRHLKVIADGIGFNPEADPTKRLTSKILRKTAGAVFLRIGYTLEAVSRFMGHASVRTTEQYYLKITSSYVDHEMARINQIRPKQSD